MNERFSSFSYGEKQKYPPTRLAQVQDIQYNEQTICLFAKVAILPGDELSYHEHHGETEVYHILSGEGLYQDNDKTYSVEAGMTTFCEDGNGHAISCKGEEPLVFLAMIQKKEA